MRVTALGAHTRRRTSCDVQNVHDFIVTNIPTTSNLKKYFESMSASLIRAVDRLDEGLKIVDPQAPSLVSDERSVVIVPMAADGWLEWLVQRDPGNHKDSLWVKLLQQQQQLPGAVLPVELKKLLEACSDVKHDEPPLLRITSRPVHESGGNSIVVNSHPLYQPPSTGAQ